MTAVLLPGSGVGLLECPGSKFQILGCGPAAAESSGRAGGWLNPTQNPLHSNFLSLAQGPVCITSFPGILRHSKL